MSKIERIGVGFGVMLYWNKKVLLGKRHDDPEKASSLLNGAGTWTMPGGKLQPGESFEQGAIREVKEETGILVETENLSLISVSNDIVETAHFVTVGLYCENFSGQAQVLEPDEITDWRWFEINRLPENIFFPTMRILKNYLSGTIYAREALN